MAFVAEGVAGRIVREDRLGLVYGRLRGLRESRGDVVLFLDDDNVLAPDYLERGLALFAERPLLGNLSGRILPRFETTPPPPWLDEFRDSLALRDAGEDERFERIEGTVLRRYPAFAFAGGGAFFRRAAMEDYFAGMDEARAHFTGRSGKNLTSGEDNDIVLTLLKRGWEVGYSPRLVLHHLIPGTRLDPRYLARLNRAISRSWVQVLHRHGICPWPSIPAWTLPLRKARAYLRHRAWRGPVEYIRWQAACGTFEGQASLG